MRLFAARFILLLLVAVFMPSTIVSATDNVTVVATDNFTIGFSDNLTIQTSGNVTISGVVGIDGLVESFEDIVDQVLAAIIGLAIILLLVILAFWHRDPIMYVLAGFSFILYGFSLWTTSGYLSILLVVAGIALFVKARVKRE